MDTASGSATAPEKPPPKRRAGMRRAVAGAWLVVIGVVVEQGAQGLFSGQPPALFVWLGSLVLLQGERPLWLKLLSLLAVLIGVAMLGGVTYVAWWQTQEDNPDTSQAQPTNQGDIEVSGTVKAGVAAIGMGAQATATYHAPVHQGNVYNAPVYQQVTSPAPEIPPTVSAPIGMPRAVSFVGRAKERQGLLAQLRAGANVGVFALAGMGGVGKTALAAEAVARLAEEQEVFPGGAVWTACEDAQGPAGLAEVWTRIARALGLEQVAALPDAERRRSALQRALMQGQRRVLALDNVDGLDAEALLETLAVQGHTTLLLTARQTIDLPGLVARSLDILPATEAEALFAQTLTRSSPREPRPTPDDLAVLPGLVANLGGLPLAIELTASYAGRQGLVLATVREELTRDGVEAAPFLPAQHPQQRALVLRFDRSWQALADTPRRQKLFASLSLLKGDSFPRAAALALAMTTGGKRATPASAAGDLAALVDYALVETLSGERLRLHPLLRDYASKRLAGDTKAARERLGEAMVAYWLAYAEAHPGYEGMDALEAEAPGLLGALAWAYEQARHREVLELARALSHFWYVRWRINDARRARPWALEAARALGNKEAERWATHELAVLDAQTGRDAEARASYEHVLELARQLGDLAAEREELHELAGLDYQMERWEEARAGHECALELARQLGDLAAERQEVHALAVLDARTGRDTEARTGYERALELARQLGDPNGEALELQSLGGFIGQRGEPERGRELVEQSLALNK